jgi:hypothetical protein
MLAALVLVLAACGGDPVGDAAADTPYGDGGSIFDDAGGDTLPGSVGNTPGLSGECEAIANLSLAMSSAFLGNFNGFDGNLIGSLPSGIQADGAIVVGALQEFSDGLAAAGIDLASPSGMAGLSPEQMEAFSTLSEEIFDDEVNDAFDRIGEAAEAECSTGS